MDKDEMKMIKDIMAVIVRHHSGLGCDVLCDGDQCENCYLTAKDLYYAKYRKVGDDEIVVKKSEYEALANDLDKVYDDGRKETATKIVEWLIYFCGGVTPPINAIADEYGLDAYAIRKRMIREGVEKAMKEGGECPCINLDELED